MIAFIIKFKYVNARCKLLFWTNILFPGGKNPYSTHKVIFSISPDLT